MGIINKLIKRGANEVDDDLEFEDEVEAPEESPAGGSSSGSGLMGWIRNRRNKGEDDEEVWEDPDEEPEESLDENPDEEDGEGSGESEDASPVQIVRLEGIPDVHPVGDSGEASMSTAPQPDSAAGTTPGSPPPNASAPETPAEAGALDTTDALESPNETQEESGSGEGNVMGGGLGLSLKDIFEDEVEVDESLKDLADSMDDVSARELADELKGLLEGLESRMGNATAGLPPA